MPDATPPTTPVITETPAEKAGPSNLRLRVIWGVIGAVLLLGSVWFSPWTFGLFFAAVQAIMLWEFYRMMRAGGYAPATWIGVGASFLLLPIIYFATIISVAPYHPSVILKNSPALFLPMFFHGFANGKSVIEQMAEIVLAHDIFTLKILLMPLLLLPVVLMIREMNLWPENAKPFLNIGSTLLGLVYVSLPMSLLWLVSVNLNDGVYDPRRIFALLFLIWASDIGAYAVGRAIGKHKLAPKISPGKTWEGWAGGFVMTLIVGWAIGYMLPELPLLHRLVAAGVVAVFAPLGDLAESMLKRSVGVKDSGSIMPGHGGLLDRFDAFLLVLPVLVLLQLLVG